jgi:hypothetical protein
MKKVLSFLVAAAVGGILLFAPEAGQAVPVKVKGEIWARWTGVIETNSARFSDLNPLTVSRMSVERGYLSIEPTLSDTVSGRFTLDFYSDSESKGWLAGAGMKLKYAYLSWLTPVPMFDISLIAGLQKSLFGTIGDYEHVIFEKDLADRTKLIKSAENAVAIQGYLPRGFGEFSFQVANGEGYETAGSKLNLNPACIANLRLIPLPGVMLGVSMDYEYSGQHAKKAANLGETNKVLYAGTVKLSFDPVEFRFQYLEKDVGRSHHASKGYVTSHYWMSMLVFNFRNLIDQDLQVVCRADFDDPSIDAHMTRDGFITAVAGVNWGFVPDSAGKSQVNLQLNYEGKYSEVPAGHHGSFKPVHMIVAQVRWAFGASIPE